MGDYLPWNNVTNALKSTRITIPHGKVTAVTGSLIEGILPEAHLGDTCEIGEHNKITAEVIGFDGKTVKLMAYHEPDGIAPGMPIKAIQAESYALVSEDYLGRIIDGLGRPLDDYPLPKNGTKLPLRPQPVNALNRAPVTQTFPLGISSIDGLMTCGEGQRLAILGSAGVGKSVLLGMVTKHSSADVCVIGLVGERGREVIEFLQRDLQSALHKSVLVVSTSDQAPLLRIRAALLATSIAEYFRSLGKKVLLVLDSLTRVAMAQREIGLAAGEPPTTKGYTPSVFSMLPRLLERAGGLSGKGSITGIYTVLTEQDDINDPIADSVRSIVDGHIVLSRRLAEKNILPAVDVLGSISRLMPNLVKPDHMQASSLFREMLSNYEEAEDLLSIGAYKQGNNPRLDVALNHIDSMHDFLKQKPEQKYEFASTITRLKKAISAEQ